MIANTKFKVILEILFLKFNNVDVSFCQKTIMWGIYTINKAIHIIKHVHIINKENFLITALDVDSKIFVMYVAI